jgi:hypothetical protein
MNMNESTNRNGIKHLKATPRGWINHIDTVTNDATLNTFLRFHYIPSNIQTTVVLTLIIDILWQLVTN